MKKYPLFEVREISSVKDMLSQSCRIYADLTAFMVKWKKGEEYSRITYKEYGEDVEAFGTSLMNLGILHGDKVSLVSENRYYWGLTYMAVLNGEAMISPLDKELAPDDIINLLNVSLSSAVVCSQAILDNLGGADGITSKAASVKYIINMDAEKSEDGVLSFKELLEKGRELVSGGNTSFRDVNINSDEAKILLFTSGTTAMSKGVLLSHKNIVTNLMAMCSMVYIDENDSFLSVLPIHHTYECTCGFMAPLYRGSSIAYCDGLRYIQKNLKESKATMMLGVPAIFEAMHKRVISHAKKSGLYKKMQTGMRLTGALNKIGIDKRRSVFKNVIDEFGGHIRMFISGAAAVDVNTLKSFNSFGIDFLQGYGITECSPIVALTRKENQKPDSVGLILPCMEVCIKDANDEGVGEILCRGKNVMLGYFNNDEETKNAFEDGWFKTGDLGYLDSDGFLYITGRKKNVIVTKNGKNIYPEELEAFLNDNEYVKESMVYGDDSAENDGDTVISAIIVPDMERITSVMGADVSDERVEELMKAAADSLNKRNPLYKYIRNVTVQKEEFEKTTTQKIKRYLVKK